MTHYKNDFRMDRVTSGALLNQNATQISGGRLAMLGSSHISQYVPLVSPETRQTASGNEREYAKAVNDVRIDADEPVIIERIIYKYNTDGVKIIDGRYSPVIIVSRGLNPPNKMYVTEVPFYISNHTMWGYSLVRTELMNSLYEGMIVNDEEKILAHGPSRTPDGNFAFGAEVNCSYLGLFNTNEDGCSAAMSVKDIYRTEMYTVTDIYVEPGQTLLNKHGTMDVMKPLPSVGDKLNAKGLIAVKRDIRKSYGLVSMSKAALTKTARPFDQEIHALPFSEVVEVEVISGPRADLDKMPAGLVSYMNSLVANRRRYLEELYKINRQHTIAAKEAGLEDYARHPTAQIAMVAAEREVGQIPDRKPKPSIIIGDTVTNGYYIRVVTRKINKPQLGHKFTGLSAEKFVICSFVNDDDMPKDQWGRFAHFNANPVGAVNRNNPSQLNEQYTTDACFHARRRLIQLRDAGASIEDMWQYLLGFYEVVSPTTKNIIDEALTVEEIPAYLENIFNHRIDLEDEIGDEHLGASLIERLVGSEYRPPRGRVTFRDPCGVMRTSKYPVRVSNKYIFAMEKIGKYASAANIPLRQNSGFAAKQSSQQKRIAQVSSKPSRVFGEAEFRAIVANGGAKLAKRLITILSSPRANKIMADQALGKLGFMNIEEMEYRSHGMNMFRHQLQCFGFDLEYIPEEDVHGTWVLTEEELGEPL